MLNVYSYHINLKGAFHMILCTLPWFHMISYLKGISVVDIIGNLRSVRKKRVHMIDLERAFCGLIHNRTSCLSIVYRIEHKYTHTYYSVCIVILSLTSGL